MLFCVLENMKNITKMLIFFTFFKFLVDIIRFIFNISAACRQLKGRTEINLNSFNLSSSKLSNSTDNKLVYIQITLKKNRNTFSR